MKSFTLLIVTPVLLASALYVYGFGVDLGPFSMQVDTDNGYQSDEGYPSGYGFANSRAKLDSPICYAISNLKKLVITVEGDENISTKETKTIIKNLTVEPYAFGIARDGSPVLSGNVVAEKLVKEINVKYGEDKFDQSSVPSQQKNNGKGVQDKSADGSNQTDKGYFTGKFTSDKNKNIDIRKISRVQVIEDSHFDVPKDYKGIKDENIQVVCQLPVAKQR